MRIVECKDEKAWVDEINSWLAHEIESQHARRIFIPAGETPRPLYRSWQRNHFSNSKPSQQVVECLSLTTLVQLDEVLNDEKPFRNFFRECLPQYCEQIEFIEVAEKGADIALLGLGLNGHIAFHEPGIGDNFFSGCLELSAETISRLKLPPHARGITYGLDAFMKSKSVGLIVRGEGKAQILRKILRPECRLPAARLKAHPNFTIFSDFKIESD